MDRTIQSAQTFTNKQGQYLAFIHAYTLVNGHAPAQALFQSHPTVGSPDASDSRKDWADFTPAWARSQRIGSGRVRLAAPA